MRRAVNNSTGGDLRHRSPFATRIQQLELSVELLRAASGNAMWSAHVLRDVVLVSTPIDAGKWQRG